MSLDILRCIKIPLEYDKFSIVFQYVYCLTLTVIRGLDPEGPVLAEDGSRHIQTVTALSSVNFLSSAFWFLLSRLSILCVREAGTVPGWKI